MEKLGDIETKAVLKATAKAHQALGELKGLAVTMPNQYLLLATLSLQEAKESSEIENIITTQDDLYRSNYKSQQFISTSAKEVHNYAQALAKGFDTINKTGLLTNNTDYLPWLNMFFYPFIPFAFLSLVSFLIATKYEIKLRGFIEALSFSSLNRLFGKGTNERH